MAVVLSWATRHETTFYGPLNGKGQHTITCHDFYIIGGAENLIARSVKRRGQPAEYWCNHDSARFAGMARRYRRGKFW